MPNACTGPWWHHLTSWLAVLRQTFLMNKQANSQFPDRPQYISRCATEGASRALGPRHYFTANQETCIFDSAEM